MGAAGSKFIIGTKLYIALSTQAIAASLYYNNDNNIIKFEFFVQII